MSLRIDVIRLAGDAGFGPDFTQSHIYKLERLVDLAQAAECEQREKLQRVATDERARWAQVIAFVVEELEATESEDAQREAKTLGSLLASNNAPHIPLLPMVPSDEVAAAVAAEREECAKVCDDLALTRVGAIIRARGNP
jgi:hypothetical protein